MISPATLPHTMSAIIEIKAFMSTSMFASTAVRPFTVAITPNNAIRTFVRKSNSRRISSSGNNHLSTFVPASTMTPITKASPQAINGKEKPGREKMTVTST